MIKVAFIPKADGALMSERPLLHFAEALAEQDILWGAPCDEADVIWTLSSSVPNKPDRPRIALSVVLSGALLGPDRTVITRPDVKLLVKTARYRPVSLVNAPHYHRSVHEAIVHRDTGAQTRCPPGPRVLKPSIAPEHFRKIRLGFNWTFLPEIVHRIQTWEPLRYNTDRDIDVFFVGTTDYPGFDMVTRHRRFAVKALRQLPGKVVVGDARAYGPRKYWELLERSRVVVSPWGHADTCVRDVEAVLAGCALVKPDTSFVDTWPDYHALATCRFCRADFRDLGAVVGRVLDSWSDQSIFAMSAAYWLRDLCDYRVLASRIASLVREALGEEMHGIDRLRWDFPWPAHKPPIDEDLHGWFTPGNRRSLGQFLSDDTRLILELGSWLGKSARWMLDKAPHATLVAVDTWNGTNAFLQLKMRDRLPTCYATFLRNCWSYRDRLIPVRRRTVDGMRLVAEAGLAPDLIYIDADHSYSAAKADMEMAHELFPEARLVGDDYQMKGVKRAVDEFARDKGLRVKVAAPDGWWLE